MSSCRMRVDVLRCMLPMRSSSRLSAQRASHAIRCASSEHRQSRFRDTRNRVIEREDVHRAIEAAKARSEEHTSELQSLMRNSYAVFCLKKKKHLKKIQTKAHTP